MPKIVSVCHTPLELFNGTLGLYRVLGRGEVGIEEGRFTTCYVDPILFEPEDIGGRRIIHERDGRAFAEAIVKPHAERGIFVAAKGEPSEPELRAAEDRYHNWLRRMYDLGLQQWDKAHRPDMVDAHAKIAAHVFQVSAPWGAPSRTSVTRECPGCGLPVPLKLVYHTACDTVVDQEEGERIGHPKALEAKRLRLELARLEKEPVAAGKSR